MHVSAIIYFVSAIGCGNCFASLSQSQKNMYLTRHVITRYWGVDWLQCIEFCSEDRRCVSYNYGANSGLCELNDLAVPVCGSNSISDIRVAKGMVYHQIKKTQSECHRTEDDQCDCNCDKENHCHVDNQYPTELGESPNRPADSCNSIYNRRSPSPRSGVYYIRTNTPQKYTRVYCHMDELNDCGGGGWTLVMKIDGNKNTFRYEATEYWQGQKSYNECACRDLEPSECKSATYWSTEIKKGYCLGMEFNGTRSWTMLKNTQGHGVETLQDNMLLHQVTSLRKDPAPEETVRRWKKLLPVSVLKLGCGVIEGIKVALPDISAKTRIGIFGLPKSECEKSASWIGFGLSEKLPGSNISITCGNLASNRAPVIAMGYILVQ